MDKKFDVFILEDDPNRIKAFKQRFIDDMPDDIHSRIETTSNVEEAKKILSRASFDLVLLDHDLAAEHYGDYLMENGTGYELAKWLEENPAIAEKNRKYMSHSLNFHGRSRIIAALRSIGIFCFDVPFLWEVDMFWKYAGGFKEQAYGNAMEVVRLTDVV